MKLTNVLVILDLETTGIWIEKDRIIEIAMIKCHIDGKKETYTSKVNPKVLIPTVVTELTGITDKDVEQAPCFHEIASKVRQFIGDCDLAGFNIERFDLPVLERELREAGVSFDWKEAKIYDTQKIFHVNEKRDLDAAHKFYCAKTFEHAHSALADTQAALNILEAQVMKYGDGSEDIESLDKFQYKNMLEYFDEDKRFRWWNGKLYMMFGKYARKHSLEDVARQDPKYLEWIISANFSDEVKELVGNALKGQFPKLAKS